MRVIAVVACLFPILAPLALAPAASAQAPAATVPAAAAPATAAAPANDGPVTRSDGFSLLGQPKLPPDYPNLPYVNPTAPKGGTVTLSAIGNFDSFSPFIIRGTSAAGVDRVWDTLLYASADEASTAYGLLAKDVEMPADHKWVAFDLRTEAKFNDGTPVTAQDVAWTFRTLLEKGRPFYRLYYANVSEVTTEGTQRVVFHFKNADSREMPLILGEMPILPEHWWKGRDFTAPLTEPPLGSGPYRVGAFEFGRSVTYQRVPNWWAVAQPIGKGLNNFDTIRMEYFRDATVAMEAFKAGQVDFRQENIAKNWATAYDFPAVQRGLVKKRDVRHRLPTGMQGFAMNTRRAVFKDVRVREAMDDAFDFEWMNHNLFFDAYARTRSYFSNSELASTGVPQGPELALLEKYKDKLPPSLFTQPFQLPVTDGSGNNRPQLMHALGLLKEAGWTVKDRKLVDAQGQQMTFTILLEDPIFERVALPYKASLERLGISVNVRTVDPSEYQHLTDAFDYDMTITSFGESDSPGNEQRDYWTCAAAKEQGSSNIMGICDPVVDALVNDVVGAPDYEHLKLAARALDRVLLAGWYLVPNYHSQVFRIAYWDRFGIPDKPVRAGFVLNSWWIDTPHATATDAAKQAQP